jgi:arginase family enzyme
MAYDAGMTAPNLLTLTVDEIQVLLRLLTEDQLAVSLEIRETQPLLEEIKQSVWEKLHDALEGLTPGSVSIQ